MPDEQNPFSEEDLTQMQTNLEKIKAAKLAVQKARLAGVDMGDAEKQLIELDQQIRKVAITYFPGRLR